MREEVNARLRTLRYSMSMEWTTGCSILDRMRIAKD